MFYKEYTSMMPKQVKGLVPAKNKDQIGLADKDKEKFYVLDHAFLNVWLLCNGEKSEDEIAEEFTKFLKENTKGKDAKIDDKLLKEDVKTIINKLKKYGLIE